MQKFIVKTVLSALAVMGCTYLLPGVHLNGSFVDAFVVALVLAVLNSFLRPILVFFTLPITVLTLGLFLIVLNGIIVYAASALLSFFQVDGLLWAVIFSVVYSFFGMIIEKFTSDEKDS
jgi:putative membrane protein